MPTRPRRRPAIAAAVLGAAVALGWAAAGGPPASAQGMKDGGGGGYVAPYGGPGAMVSPGPAVVPRGGGGFGGGGGPGWGGGVGTTVLVEVNGWRAFGGVGSSGIPLCGMGTAANRVGRFFWIKAERQGGVLTGYVQLGANTWTVRDGARGEVVVNIDGRDVRLAYAGAGRDIIEATYAGRFDNFLRFVELFAGGSRMQIRFPGENLEPWGANLGGTRRVTEAFLACARNL